jgi:hypothetical protein
VASSDIGASWPARGHRILRLGVVVGVGLIESVKLLLG